MDNFIIDFLMKIITMTIQLPNTSPNLVAANNQLWEETLSKTADFPENPTALTCLRKVPRSTIFSPLNTVFFQPNYLKAVGPSISEH